MKPAKAAMLLIVLCGMIIAGLSTRGASSYVSKALVISAQALMLVYVCATLRDYIKENGKVFLAVLLLVTSAVAANVFDLVYLNILTGFSLALLVFALVQETGWDGIGQKLQQRFDRTNMLLLAVVVASVVLDALDNAGARVAARVFGPVALVLLLSRLYAGNTQLISWQDIKTFLIGAVESLSQTPDWYNDGTDHVRTVYDVNYKGNAPQAALTKDALWSLPAAYVAMLLATGEAFKSRKAFVLTYFAVLGAKFFVFNAVRYTLLEKQNLTIKTRDAYALYTGVPVFLLAVTAIISEAWWSLAVVIVGGIFAWAFAVSIQKASNEEQYKANSIAFRFVVLVHCTTQGLESAVSASSNAFASKFIYPKKPSQSYQRLLKTWTKIKTSADSVRRTLHTYVTQPCKNFIDRIGEVISGALNTIFINIGDTRIVPVLQVITVVIVASAPPYGTCSNAPKLTLLGSLIPAFVHYNKVKSKSVNDLLQQISTVLRAVAAIFALFSGCSSALTVVVLAWNLSPAHDPRSDEPHASFHIFLYIVTIAIQASVQGPSVYNDPTGLVCGFGTRPCDTNEYECCCTEGNSIFRKPVVVAESIVSCAPCTAALQKSPPNDCCGRNITMANAHLMAGSAGCLCAGNGEVIDIEGTFSCVCSAGFSGTRCDMNEDSSSGWSTCELAFAGALTGTANASNLSKACV